MLYEKSKRAWELKSHVGSWEWPGDEAMLCLASLYVRLQLTAYVYNFTYLFHFFALVVKFKFELVMAIVESLDLLFHFSLLFLGVGDLQERLDLCEESPPLPVAQLEVALNVALDDSDGSVLFHALLVGPAQ